MPEPVIGIRARADDHPVVIRDDRSHAWIRRRQAHALASQFQGLPHENFVNLAIGHEVGMCFHHGGTVTRSNSYSNQNPTSRNQQFSVSPCLRGWSRKQRVHEFLWVKRQEIRSLLSHS